MGVPGIRPAVRRLPGKWRGGYVRAECCRIGKLWNPWQNGDGVSGRNQSILPQVIVFLVFMGPGFRRDEREISFGNGVNGAEA